MKALSVIEKAGIAIASGKKTLEIRRWRPDRLPLIDLAIVQSKERLSRENPVEEDGKVVAIVDVRKVREWRKSDAEGACSEWEEGWLAWELENVRKVSNVILAPAKLRIYEIDLNIDEIDWMKR